MVSRVLEPYIVSRVLESLYSITCFGNPIWYHVFWKPYMVREMVLFKYSCIVTQLGGTPWYLIIQY